MGRQETRRRILEAGAGLVLARGFARTGIGEVAAAAGVPRGSFHFYFPSKEAFGLALVDFFAANLEAFEIGRASCRERV